MVHILTRFIVHDVPRFLSNFIERDQIRFEKGCSQYKLFQQNNNDNVFTLIFEWGSKSVYDDYFKNHAEEQVAALTKRFEDVEILDLVSEIEVNSSNSDFYVLAKLTVNPKAENSFDSAKEMEKSYPPEIMEELNMERIEVYSSPNNQNIVSILAKWKNNASYYTWLKSEGRRDINQKSAMLGKEFGSDHYRLKLIRSRHKDDLV